MHSTVFHADIEGKARLKIRKSDFVCKVSNFTERRTPKGDESGLTAGLASDVSFFASDNHRGLSKTVRAEKVISLATLHRNPTGSEATVNGFAELDLPAFFQVPMTSEVRLVTSRPCARPSDPKGERRVRLACQPRSSLVEAG
jgi:hypothetical protein